MKITKKALRREVPRPSLEITPLSSQQDVAGFIDRFSLLQKVRVELVDVNNEIDPDGFFSGLREHKDALESRKTVVEHVGANGLDKAVASDIFGDLGPVGNHKLYFQGRDSAGDLLKGNNEDFSLKVPVEGMDGQVAEMSQKACQTYENVIARRLVARPIRVENIVGLVERFVGIFRAFRG